MLTPGTKLAHYEILDSLGAGGMGEVYRARDDRLGRDVALKVLPEAFLHDPDRLARFRREAQALASLNHPHIAAIHGLEEVAGQRFLVLELVEGETLDLRIARGALPSAEALDYARQMAEALEAAHDKGIIHRDLKPSNIKITPVGSVKLLDFGLAKAFEDEVAPAALGTSPTLTAAATRAGVILGTAAYMSPEQARAKEVDRRADIWAFGCVLYEMLTGQQAFPGETVSDTLAAVLKTEPDWKLLPADTPAQVFRLLRRCLQKNWRQRLQSIADARLEVEEALTAPAAPLDQAPPAVSSRGRRLLLVWGLAGLLLGVLLAGTVMWILRPSPAAPAVVRATLTLAPGQQFSLEEFPAVTISPDGSQLVYVAEHEGKRQLYLRLLNTLQATPLQGTEGARSPFFSPDGQWVGFFAEGKLKKIPVLGGGAITLADAPTNRGASWASGDTIIFVPEPASGLWRVSSAGGTPEELSKPDTGQDERTHRWPEVLPGGEAVLFVIGSPRSPDYYLDARLAWQSLRTGARKILPIQGTYPRYASSGHLIYVRPEGVFAVRFDAKRGEVTGNPVLVLEGAAVDPTTGAAHLALSPTGTATYVPGNSSAVVATERTLVWLDRKGVVQPLPAPPRPYRDPDISPDGRRLALSIWNGKNDDIWVYDLARGTLTRLTFEAGNWAPIWSPDGKRIVFVSDRDGKAPSLFWKPADGSAPEERLTAATHEQVTESFSPDGKLLVYSENDPQTRSDLWVLPLEGERKPRPLIRMPFGEWGAEFSPDGRWLAYVSDESGRQEIYVQPFPGLGGKWQISTEGGSFPVWARNGREIFYRNGNQLMRVVVAATPGFTAGTPDPLFETPFPRSAPFVRTVYAVSGDGQRFLLPRDLEAQAVPDRLHLVLNWSEELKWRVPAKK